VNDGWADFLNRSSHSIRCAQEVQVTTLLGEITVTWWCCRCNKTGQLVFGNQNTIGERLEFARGEHKILSSDCELDWNQVYVRMDIDE